MYLNETFTTLRLNDLTVWNKHLNNWPKRAPLCVHAESQTTAAIIFMASLANRFVYQTDKNPYIYLKKNDDCRPVHVCHVARKEEILIIKAAKEKGLKVTCEVCPHHLFLSTKDVAKLGPQKSQVRPVC